MQNQAPQARQICSPNPSRGASKLGMLTILAIACVVVFVSVPRLRSFALNENESDARYIVSILAKQLTKIPAEASSQPELLIELLVQSPSVKQAISDGEFLKDGLLLRRHGYLFRITIVDQASGKPQSDAGTVLADTRAVLGVQAWPWRHGRTGSAALLGTDDGLVFRHANQSATWNGPLQEHRSLADWTGWRLLP